MVAIREIKNADIEFADEIMELAKEATSFLTSHTWCKRILNGFFDRGWGYILGVFYFEIEPGSENADNFVWVIVGDIPPAYVDIESAANGLEAIKCYVDIMGDWVNNVKQGGAGENCYPVTVSPTLEHATMLENRLRLIKEQILM
jgi:hypothetical protein